MSGTLKRLSSIRSSLRPPRKKDGLKKDVCSSMPEKVEQAGLKATDSSNQTYFCLSVADATVSVNGLLGYSPSHLCLVVCRHKKKYRSNILAWEPSLKCVTTGSVVWHPPFECVIAITPPAIKDPSEGTLRHKDITIAIKNVDKYARQSSKSGKKHRKLLAKLRLNLADYYKRAGPNCDSGPSNFNHKPVSFKLKLRPESSKVKEAYVNLSIRRTDVHPGLAAQIQQETERKVMNEEFNLVATTVPVNALAGKRPSWSDTDSEDSISQLSQKNSSIASPKSTSPIEEDKYLFQTKGEENYTPNSLLPPQSCPPKNASPEEISLPKNNSKSQTSLPPIAPPPLPLRDWEKKNLETSTSLAPSTINTSVITAATQIDTSLEGKDAQHHGTPIGAKSHFKAEEPLLEPLFSEEKQKQAKDDDHTAKCDNRYHPADAIEMPTKKDDIIPISTVSAAATESVSKTENDKSRIKDVMRATADKTKLPKSKEELSVSETTKNHSNGTSFASARGTRSRDISPAVAHEKKFEIKVPPSPVMRPKKQNTKEKELLDWAKKALSTQEPPIKVTNLSSSWRNGLGFCALIRQEFPEIIPPISHLKRMSYMSNMSQNSQLAFEAAKLIGVDTSTLISVEDTNDSQILDKTVVQDFLQQLKTILENKTKVELSIDETTSFQCKWYRRAGFFAGTAAEIVHKQELDQKNAEEEGQKKQQAEQEQLEREQFEQKREENRRRLYENGEQFSSPVFNLENQDRERNREKIQKMILEAHSSMDSEENNLVKQTEPRQENLDLPDTDFEINLKKVIPDSTHGSPDSEPTLSSTYQSCKNEVSSTSDEIYPGMPQSQTIAEELSQLTKEEERITKDKDELEEMLREEDYDTNDLEIVMQKWMQLVNQKNSVVRRQMQLNINEKEKIASYDLERIQAKLQKFTDLDESRKTDAMKEEEKELLDSLVALVNKKNELVLQLHSQEEAIADDERVQNLVQRRDFGALKQEEKCILQ